METASFKALSQLILQGNKKGNLGETEGFSAMHSDGNLNLDELQIEYFRLLSRWWEVDEDSEATMDEVGQLLNRLDYLYQALLSQGRKVPVRLPVERSRS